MIFISCYLSMYSILYIYKKYIKNGPQSKMDSNLFFKSLQYIALYTVFTLTIHIWLHTYIYIYIYNLIY